MAFRRAIEHQPAESYQNMGQINTTLSRGPFQIRRARKEIFFVKIEFCATQTSQQYGDLFLSGNQAEIVMLDICRTDGAPTFSRLNAWHGLRAATISKAD